MFLKGLLASVGLISAVHSAAAPNTAGCTKACGTLTLLPNPLNGTLEELPGQYWANQIAAIVPACYVRPQTSAEVASIIKVARQYSCPFAVSGGGHSDNPGANNLQDGITIDLSLFKDIKVSSDHTVTSVGPGLRWGNVYQYLEPLGLIVLGGREYQVGVPGLTLGGGVSYLSGIHGWACDNVKNYEIVLADGRVVNANASGAYADLYKALRGGGGNNFGVITRFDLDTYPQGLMNGGLVIWNDSMPVQQALVDAFVNFTKGSASDPNGHVFLAIDSVAGNTIWSGGLYYSQPVSSPKVLQAFRTPLLNSAKTLETTRNASYANFAIELGATQPAGRREQFNTATFKMNAKFMNALVQIYREEAARAAAAYTGLTPFTTNFAMQPVTTNEFKFMSRRGGNVLGLADEKESLFIVSMSWPWDDPKDDALFEGGMQRIISRGVALAKTMGTFYGYVYMNYAIPSDHVIQSYGPDNVQFLKKVSKKYDPSGVFQTLVPGGFKL